MTFQKTKIKINNEEHSEKVQEILFAAGYSWEKGGKIYKYTDAPFLFTTETGKILFSDYESTFLATNWEEVFFDEDYAYENIDRG